MRQSRIVITCAKGIPPFLKEEILSLKLSVRSESVAGVETEGTMEDAMRLNLGLRTASGFFFWWKKYRPGTRTNFTPGFPGSPGKITPRPTSTSA